MEGRWFFFELLDSFFEGTLFAGFFDRGEFLIPLGCKFLGEIGVLLHKILRFGAVGGEVVEFPRFVFGGDEFPVVDTDGAVVVVEPPE